MFNRLNDLRQFFYSLKIHVLEMELVSFANFPPSNTGVPVSEDLLVQKEKGPSGFCITGSSHPPDSDVFVTN